MMKHKRKSIRLPNWDYSSIGYYFVTICTFKRECIFGDIENGKMVLNENGEIVNSVLNSLPNHHSIDVYASQIMPNHLHVILNMCRGVACNAHKKHLPSQSGVARYAPTDRDKNNIYSQMSPSKNSIPTIIRSFKSECTKQIRILHNHPNLPVWQRNYYERIIRTEHEYFKIKKYIEDNPMNWDMDKNNLDNL